MRVFKFRAWHTKEKKMLSDFLYSALLSARLDNKIPWNDGIRKVMQYTGMQDTQGNDIYEGDIVAFRYPPAFKRIGTVTFNDGCFDVEFTPSIHLPDGTIRQWDYLKVFVGNHAVEVLGNIYEHPHLLETKP